MKRLLLSLSVVALGAAAFFTTRAIAGEPAPAPSAAVPLGNAVCPVTGLAVKPSNLAVWQGVAIGFCSPECSTKFAQHPDVYTPALLKEMAAQVAALKAKLPATAPSAAPAAPPVQRPPTPALALPVELGNGMCPVMNRPVKAGLFVEYHGMKVGLCCPGCDGKFKADPATYLGVLHQDPNVAQKIDAAESAWTAAHPR